MPGNAVRCWELAWPIRLSSFSQPSLPSPKQEKQKDEPRLEHHENEDVGEVVAVFARCAAHHLEDVGAFHKEVGDKCFHTSITPRGAPTVLFDHNSVNFTANFEDVNAFRKIFCGPILRMPLVEQ